LAEYAKKKNKQTKTKANAAYSPYHLAATHGAIFSSQRNPMPLMHR